MNAVFLSDAHIRDHEDPNLPPLLAFFDRLRGQVERVFIVGDLFDTWFGFRRAVFDEYVAILGALDALKRSGVEIVYVTGNHDFEMGHFFESILGAEVHDTEMTVEADGIRAFVAHGDMVNPRDRGYRRLRTGLRCPLTRWVGRRLPPAWVWGVARALRRGSRGGESRKYTEFRRLFSEYAAARHKQGYDVVVLGHLHIPEITKTDTPAGPKTYVNLGDWVTERTFLRWVDGRLSLRKWAWPEGAEEEFTPPSDGT